LILLARTLEQIQAACTWQHESELAPLAMVWVDVEDPRQWEEAIAICRGASIDVGLAPLRIVKPGEEGLITRAARLKPDAILVRNLATLELLRSSGIPLVGDYSLNIVNDLTAAWFFAQGLKRLTPGHDLNWQQLQAWLAHDHPDAIECIAHVAMPMFHTEHCVYAAHLSTGKDHTDCGRPCEQHRIRLVDPTGAHFPVMVDAGCRNTVFNAHVQSASEYIPRLIGMGVRNFRIELLGETPSEIHNLLTLYNRVLGGRDDGHGLWRSLRASSRVGLTRGTLNLA
jgi:putative protease